MTLHLRRTEKRWEEKQSEIYYPQPDYKQGRRFNGRPKWHASVTWVSLLKLIILMFLSCLCFLYILFYHFL